MRKKTLVGYIRRGWKLHKVGLDQEVYHDRITHKRINPKDPKIKITIEEV